MGFSRGPKIVTDGLVLALDAANPKSYPGSGTTWSDLSGNGNDGTLVNGVGYDSTNNGSMVFDGVDDYISIASQQILNLSNDFTTTIWYSSIAEDPQLLYSRYPDGYILGTRSAEWKVTKYGVVDIYLGENPNDNEVHSISVVYSSTQGVMLFLDGLLVDSSGNTSDLKPTSEMRIGLAQYGNHYGNISNVQIYNRALTEAEIKQNYNALKGRYGL